jgi:hypothetical protein
VACDVRGVPLLVGNCSQEWREWVCLSVGQVVRVLVLGEIGVIAWSGRLSV